MTKSIMIVGVGGQGTLLASRILGNLIVTKGYDLKVSEVHGMAQRGGSVVTYVRFGEKVYSPIVTVGEADIILAFEQLEAYRWVPYLKENGKLIMNTQKMEPMPVITGAAEYPSDISAKLKNYTDSFIELDALKLAVEAGNAKAVNVVLIGVMAQDMEFSEEEWTEAIKKTVPEKFVDINIKAFLAGYHYKYTA